MLLIQKYDYLASSEYHEILPVTKMSRVPKHQMLNNLDSCISTLFYIGLTGAEQLSVSVIIANNCVVFRSLSRFDENNYCLPVNP